LPLRLARPVTTMNPDHLTTKEIPQGEYEIFAHEAKRDDLKQRLYDIYLSLNTVKKFGTMNTYKDELLEKICYTDLVYDRINKKLDLKLSKDEIEEMILITIKETDESEFYRKGKNIYIVNKDKNIRLTINSFTNRIITADRLSK